MGGSYTQGDIAQREHEESAKARRILLVDANGNILATFTIGGTVGILDAAGNRINPAKEDGNLATLTAKDFATQATLALVKAKTDNLDVAVSTLAKESGGNLATLAGKDFATQTTLALVKAKTDNLDILLSAFRDAITGSGGAAKTLADIVTKLAAGLPSALVGGRMDVNVGNTPTVSLSQSGSSNDVDVLTVPADPFGANADASVAAGAVGSIQAKLRRISADIGSILTNFDVALSTRVAESTFTGRIGEVQASPTANTVLDRLKALLTGIVLAAGTALIGKVKLRNPSDSADLGDSSNPVRTDPTGTTKQPISISQTTTDNDVDVASMPTGSSAAQVQGTAASGASVAGNPLGNGGRGSTALPTAVSDGQRIEQMLDKYGRTVAATDSVRDLWKDEQTTITSTTTAATINTAGGTGVYCDIKAIWFTNTSATGTEVQLLDNDGTTVRGEFYVPANDMRGVSGVFLPQASTNTQWKVKTVTSIASLKVSVSYIKNK
jgi:hypothetical protein